MSVIKELRNNVLKNWDTSYPLFLFKPCHAFQGETIHPSKNRQIPRHLFDKVKLLEDVVKHFKTLYKHLCIEHVWLSRKCHNGDGFQGWDQDIVEQMSYTIVLNLGSDNMDLLPERSEVVVCQEISTPKKAVGEEITTPKAVEEEIRTPNAVEGNVTIKTLLFETICNLTMSTSVVADVQGYGLSQVNGTYCRTERKPDGSHIYEKNGRWNGKDTVFRMHRCEDQWWILAGLEAVYFTPNKLYDIPPKVTGHWLSRDGYQNLCVFLGGKLQHHPMN
jgi:hypothetical protein